jgi:hypothetical protein
MFQTVRGTPRPVGYLAPCLSEGAMLIGLAGMLGEDHRADTPLSCHAVNFFEHGRVKCKVELDESARLSVRFLRRIIFWSMSDLQRADSWLRPSRVSG